MRARIALLGFVAASAFALPVSAFCRTTTCDEHTCKPHPECFDCLVGGDPIFWPGGCVSFAVNDAGSPLHGIDGESARLAIANAFERWLGASCAGGQAPGLAIYDYGLVECSRETYDQSGPNANLWVFRDEGWPYESWKIALATVRFNPESAQIRDVDVEINSEGFELSLDGSTGFDLHAVVTHEAGHFLGLAHVCETEPTMYGDYRAGSVTLETDDENGICDIYPPGTLDETCDPAPTNGFSGSCPESDEGGCDACGAAPASRGGVDIALLALGLGLSFARRRLRTSSRTRAPRRARSR
jgi:hypothetical protein